jgi:PAS fold
VILDTARNCANYTKLVWHSPYDCGSVEPRRSQVSIRIARDLCKCDLEEDTISHSLYVRLIQLTGDRADEVYECVPVHRLSYLNYIHPDDRIAVANKRIKSPNKKPNDIIYRLRGKDEIYWWFHTRTEPFFNEDGSVYRWYSLNSDIDELYRSRELLREREIQLNLLTENLPAVLFKAALDGTIVYVNQKGIEYSIQAVDPSRSKAVQRRLRVDRKRPPDLCY